MFVQITIPRCWIGSKLGDEYFTFFFFIKQFLFYLIVQIFCIQCHLAALIRTTMTAVTPLLHFQNCCKRSEKKDRVFRSVCNILRLSDQIRNIIGMFCFYSIFLSFLFMNRILISVLSFRIFNTVTAFIKNSRLYFIIELLT